MTKQHFSNDYTLEDVTRLYVYQRSTGFFIYRHGKRKGEIAGKINARGYVRIFVAGKYRYAHRVAWLYCTGEFPSLLIDHRNGLTWDNRFRNLRECDNHENGYNRKRGLNNTSGRVGVHWIERKGKYRVDIKSGGKRCIVGNFVSFEDACAARDAAERWAFGEFRRSAK